MLYDMDVLNCQGLAVPMAVMQHVVNVESSFNPFAIGVVGGHLRRQPANLSEALSTARMLARRGYNFSLGLAQVNRYNLLKYGLTSYEQAFQACPNLRAGARILADCHARSGNDWGRSLSCYYSGDFVTGFQQGYVRKVFASAGRTRLRTAVGDPSIPLVANKNQGRRAAIAPNGEPTLPALPNSDQAGWVIDQGAPATAAGPEPILASAQARTVEVHAIEGEPQAQAESIRSIAAPVKDQAFVF